MNRDQRTRSFNTSSRNSNHGSYSSLNNRGRNRRGRNTNSVILILIIVIAVLIIAAVAALVIHHFVSNNSSNNQHTSLPSPLDKDDLGKTINLTSDDVRKGDLILINESYPCLELSESDYKNIYANCEKVRNAAGKEVRAYCLTSTDTVIHKSALDSLNRLGVDAYKSAGNNDLTVKKNKVLSFTDGKSEDQSGLSVEFYVYTVDKITYDIDSPVLGGVYDFLFTDCSEYGFIRRGNQYQFRYVGYPHACYMTEKNLSLENYLSLLKSDHSYESGNFLIIDGENGVRYQIYYVQNNGDMTEVHVPSDASYKYTVSGDNMDGYIVTVTLN